MSSETALLLLLFLPLLVFQFMLVRRLIQHLPSIVERWKHDAGRSLNGLLNEAEQLKLLDSRFFSCGGYEALKRLGFSSPLFGVAATAILILTKSADAGQADGLGELKLLFSGVLGGAVLAITNQGCLWYVNLCFQRYRGSAVLPSDSSNLFRFVDEFRGRLEDAVANAALRSERLSTELDNAVTTSAKRTGLLLGMLEAAHQEYDESLAMSIWNAQQLHEAVQDSVGSVREDVTCLSSAINNLSEKIHAVNTELDTLKTDGLASLNDELKNVREDAETLTGNLKSLNDTTVVAVTQIGQASKNIQTSGGLILGAANSLHNAATNFMTTAASIEKRWKEFVALLDNFTREELAPQLQETIANLKTQVKASKDASQSVASASGTLKKAIEDLSGKITSVKDVGVDVSAQVTKAMTELNGSIRTTIDSQKSMLVNWRQVLDQLPVSFQSHADGVVKGLVVELSELMARNHDIMTSVQDTLDTITKKWGKHE